MIFKNRRKIEYFLNGKSKILDVKVELKMTEDVIGFGENVYYGVATVNDEPYEDPTLRTCVNAQFMVDEIIENELYKIEQKHGKSFSLKKNVTKRRKKRKIK